MAEEKTPEKADPKVSPAKTPEPLVMLYLGHPHARFELAGMGLPDLLPEGTRYLSKDADTVRTLCRKYGIRFHEAA